MGTIRTVNQPVRSLQAPEPGTKSNRWVFLEETRTDKGKRGFLCRCECGTRRVIGPSDFFGGRTKSCGCYNSEVARSRATKHGDAHSRLHWVWLGMRQRCINPEHISFKNYGARGIKVCKEWDDYAKFREWSLAHGYIEGATYRQTIDREDNDGDYSPSNCRWVSAKRNANNKRGNHILEVFGERKSMMDWSEDLRCAVGYFALRNRINRDGWDVEEAITTPSLGSGKRRSR